MTVKIIDAIKSIGTSKYSKKNIFYWAVFILCLAIITSILEIQAYTTPKLYVAYPLLLLFSMVIDCGYSTIVANKEVNKENEVFPSLNNFKEILLVGLKTIIGILIIWIIATLIIILVTGFLSLITTIGMMKEVAFEALIGIFTVFFSCLFILLAIVLDYYFLSPIILNYFKNLKFKNFFNLKEAKTFRKERGSHYTSFFVKYILLLILIIVISIVATYYTNEAINKNNNLIANLISITISFIASFVSVLIFPNLVAQVYDKSDVTDEDEEFLNKEEFEEATQEEQESYDDKIFENEDFE